MSRLFISHSSLNDDWALAVQAWLIREGWSGEEDIFLDLDPERGIVAGQRWARALEDAATRCEAVLFLVSEVWLASKWCGDEYQLASRLNKKLFALLIDDISLDRLPGGLTAQWQVVHLKGEPAERFLTVHPRTQKQSPIHIAEAALKSLKRGLTKAGIAPETFELQPDASGPFGWRAPYRGLEALEHEDAAVFFGRSADIVRGIDALRGLAARKPPRLLVVLGASGAGKSSYLRAGLWPRLVRDDSQWLPLRAIRAGRGGAIEGTEGLLHALEDVHSRFALRASRADLRQRLATPESFVALLHELRRAAARRALISAPPYPLPVLCLDEGEELFAADAGPESERLLRLARAAVDCDAALLLVTIRSDAYGIMQNAGRLTSIDPVLLNLGPVPEGEIARIIREPSEVLRRKAGPSAPIFDAAIVERLQNEIAGEMDALPLLAFVLQRLIREHAGTSTIGVKELEQTGGVAAAIEQEAEAALADAGFGPDRAERREVLRRLFIPRLARIERDSKAPQRRVARQSDLPPHLLGLARALTQRRLLVAKLANKLATNGNAATLEASAATLEVAHEALLRRWPTLADLLREDRDALLLLDGVLMAGADWDKAEAAHKPDFLVHRGSRLSDSQALSSRGADWAAEIAPARDYLTACAQREIDEREEKEAALAREQQRLVEIAAGQARTARFQRVTRWAIGAVGVVIFIAGSTLGWLQWDKARQLSTKEVALSESRQQLEQARDNVAAEQASNAELKSSLDRRQFELGQAQAALTENRQHLDQARANVAAEQASNAELKSSLDKRQLELGQVQAALTESGQHLDQARANVADEQASNAALKDTLDQRQLELEHAKANLLAELSGTKLLRGEIDSALRLASLGTRIDMSLPMAATKASPAAAALTAALVKASWLYSLGGHESTVNSAVFSPDGLRVLTASKDKTARVWDAASGREIAVLRGHEGSLNSAVFSPDGTRILTASADKTARIWDAASAKEIAVLRGHEEGVNSAAFSPDGLRIVTASSDDTAGIWDPRTAEKIAVLRNHLSVVWFAAFSPDGLRIVTASQDNTARIWDAKTAREIAILRGHSRPVRSATFNQNGSRIVTTSGDETVRIWDVRTTKQIAFLPHDVSWAGFSPDGSRIVTASWDKTVRVWDAKTTKEIAILRGHEGTVKSAAFSADGSRIVTASDDKTARIWRANGSNLIMTLRGHEMTVSSAAFSPDGSRILTASYDNTARIWHSANGKQIAVLRGHTDNINSGAFSPDGSHIITASKDNTARIWNATSAKEIAVLRSHEELYSGAFRPDGLRIVTALSDNTARIWDVVTTEEIAILRSRGDQRKDGDAMVSAVFSPDGSQIVTASLNLFGESTHTTARVWDAASGKEIAVLRGHEDYVHSAVFSPDGTRILTASADTTARIWDTASAKEIAVLRGHEEGVTSAVFSRDGSRIITASVDATARIWDAANAKEIAVLRGHKYGVESASFSPDGSRIVTASSDNTASIWDVRLETMSVKGLFPETCARLAALTKLTRDEMRLSGYPDSMPEIDVCKD